MIPDPTPPPAIPDFQLLRRIGGGSYGDVWLARGATGMYRAVKIVRADRFESSRPFIREWDGITRFQKCASGRPRQLALLHVGTNEAERFYYYSMELADDAERGSEIDPDHYVALTFKERLRRDGRITGAECLRLAVDLTQALAELHGLGLIHRDIKPSNLIFVNGQPKIADVGLVASVEEPLSAVGTPGYQAPEGPGSRAADLYSLGKVIYEMATGKGPDQFPLLPPGLVAWPDVNLVMELNEVITRACDFNPSARYQTAEEMLEALRHIQAGGSLKDWAETKRRLARVVRVAGWGAAAAAVVILALGVRSYLAIRELAQIKIRDEQVALYTADVERARRALQSGALGVAREALERQAGPDGEAAGRGLEWSLLHRESAGEEIWAASNPASVWQVALGPDGQRIAALLADSTVVLATVGAAPIRLPQTNISLIGDFTSDGQRLLLGDKGLRPLGWLDLTTGLTSGPVGLTNRVARVLPGQGGVVLYEATEAGGYRFGFRNSGDANVVRWLDTDARFRGEQFMDADADRSGRILVAILRRVSPLPWQFRLVAWDLTSGQVLWQRTFENEIRLPRISPDARQLYFAEALANGRLLDLATGNTVRDLPGHVSQIVAAEFSPDGAWLATGGDDQALRLWRASDGTFVRRLAGNVAAVTSLAWVGNTRLVTGAEDGSLRAFEVPGTGVARERRGFFRGNRLGDVLFSGDGTRLAVTTNDHSVVLLRADNLEVVGRATNLFHPFALEGDGNRVIGLTTNSSLVRVDLISGALETILADIWPTNQILAWATSSSNRWLALGAEGEAGGTRVIRLTTGESVPLAAEDAAKVEAVAFSADETMVAAGVESGDVGVWSLPDGGRRLRFKFNAKPTALAFADDGRLLFVGLSSGELAVIEVATQRKILQQPAHSQFVSGIILTPERVITAGGDGEIVFWRRPDLRRMASLGDDEKPSGPGEGGIAYLRLSPDQTALAAFTNDGRLRLWRRADR